MINFGQIQLVLLLVGCLLVAASRAQYYQPPPMILPPYFDSGAYGGGGDSASKGAQTAPLGNIEKKYVNSGQSVLLVCDLPNNMPDGKVLFIKYDSKVLSSGSSIREDSDDERFEISQQYAWEWSLKINSINEDDSGIYFCKVGNTVIQQFEIIVRVPPRIRDDVSGLTVQKTIREGENVQFSCFASGTPKPNITWYVFKPEEQTFELLPQTGSYLKLFNVTRYSPRRYQCRASNNIPPSDRRNITLSIEFPPEIEIQSKYNYLQNMMTLNCTIYASPLTNRNFWRKDGDFINEGIKHDIRNMRVNEFTFVSQLNIKNYNEFDQGLYECTGENDLRVSKIVYSLKEDQMSSRPGGAVNFQGAGADGEGLATTQETTTLTTPPRHHRKNERKNKPNKHHHHAAKKAKQQQQQQQQANEIDETPNEAGGPQDTASLNSNKNYVRKHQRNHKNNQKSDSLLIDKLSDASTSTQPPVTNYFYNSPYILLLNENDVGSSNSNEDGADKTSAKSSGDSDSADQPLIASTAVTRRHGLVCLAVSVLSSALILLLSSGV